MTKYIGKSVIGPAFTFTKKDDGMIVARVCANAKRSDGMIEIHPDALMRILDKADPCIKSPGDDPGNENGEMNIRIGK
ncbi:hypothetical protein ERD95_21835 [Enterobacteriaceae bacterium ML5]|nr:hypothetical protein ERD95_21835 [Enterobacteriaceae bacterium ML5]